jgi:excisionase family DNA binding protein
MKHIAQHSSELEFLLDQEQVAKLLGVATKTMEAWRYRGGHIPFVRVGRLVRYRRKDVESWISSNVCRSTSETAR